MFLFIRCSDARDEENGTVKIKIIELKSGPLQREDLTSDVIILLTFFLYLKNLTNLNK
jgi:hypothetical protein